MDSKRFSDRKKPSVPVIYAQFMLQMHERKGLNSQEVLNRLGMRIPADRASGLVKRISLDESENLARAIIRHAEAHGTPKGGLGFEFGLLFSPTTHGNIGFALLSQRTARDAVKLFLRISPLAFPGLHMSFSTEKGAAVLDIREEFDISPDLFQPYYDMVLSGIWHSWQALRGGKRTDEEIWFKYPEPDYYAHYRDQLPVCRFDTGVNQIRVPSQFLDRALSTGDFLTAQNLEKECLRELELLTEEMDIISRIRTLLKPGPERYSSFDELSATLRIAPSTLRRKLREKGASFHKLRDEARCEEAKKLLGKKLTSIESIATQLGYKDPANFTHAFRKWTGVTPSAYRKRSAC